MKGQVTIEFMIFVTILIFMLSIIMWNNVSLQSQMMYAKANIEVQKLCDTIAFEINSAVRAGQGYRRRFYVEEHVYGVSNYTVDVKEYAVFIDWDGNSVVSSIITKNITSGTINKGWNYIENINGELYVT